MTRETGVWRRPHSCCPEERRAAVGNARRLLGNTCANCYQAGNSSPDQRKHHPREQLHIVAGEGGLPSEASLASRTDPRHSPRLHSRQGEASPAASQEELYMQFCNMTILKFYARMGGVLSAAVAWPLGGLPPLAY